MTSLPVFSVPCFSDVDVCPPLRFTHLLSEQSDTLPLESITYITMTSWHTEQELVFSFTCFESPSPDFMFQITLGEDCPLCLSFSGKDSQLVDGVTIRRNGGENLEGIFWGALVKVPLSLLPFSNHFPCSVSYSRKNQLTSPFPKGKAMLFLQK